MRRDRGADRHGLYRSSLFESKALIPSDCALAGGLTI